ncbi:hypothetical protein RM51_15980 [Chryseobacterium taiwanense]|uniref:Uncharacterized protein n=1 Tax=Chryseobacterium taiwanense TaxID=363331 RepID=A0A0B4D5B6_9FLAO|nr:hypothetical protein RM51_15980 [Chryseobacterium taiwanense]
MVPGFILFIKIIFQKLKNLKQIVSGFYYSPLLKSDVNSKNIGTDKTKVRELHYQSVVYTDNNSYIIIISFFSWKLVFRIFSKLINIFQY